MIISRTPFRISFFGGGTDYPEWFKKNKGCTISTTIDKFCYINLRKLPPFFNYKHRFRYFEKEEVNSINQIKHPSIKNCLKFLNFHKSDDGLEIVHNADLPALSGLGSSSTFTVGLLKTLYSYNNQLITKKKLALDAIHVERNLIGEKVGSQDQTAASFGGLNYTVYEPNGSLRVENIPLSSEQIVDLEKKSLLLFTGLQRKADSIASEQVNNIINNKSYDHLNEIHKITEYALEEIFMKKKIDYKKFGLALTENWKNKRKLSKNVSNDLIDDIIESAIKYGAYGGKLLGAGGGGFILLLTPENKKNFLIKKFSKFLNVPFKIDNTGSQIIYFSSQK